MQLITTKGCSNRLENEMQCNEDEGWYGLVRAGVVNDSSIGVGNHIAGTLDRRRSIDDRRGLR